MSDAGEAKDAEDLRRAVLDNQKLIDDLNRDLSRRTREVRIIQEIAAELNATLDLDAILHAILQSMDGVFGFRHAMILLLDEGEQTLHVAAANGYPDGGIGAVVKLGQGVIGVVAQRRRLMRVGNLRSQVAYAAAIRARMQQTGNAEQLSTIATLPGLADAQSQVAIPLIVKERLVGVFAVESEQPSVFDERDEQLITILANQAASAIHNARLYRAAEERRRALDVANEDLRRLNETLEDRVRDRTRELERAQARVVQSEKMASLGTLVAGIAHEMNTPLGAMTSVQATLTKAIERIGHKLEQQHPQAAAEVGPLLGMTRDGFRVLADATQRVDGIVRRMRSFARLDEAERKLADLREGIDDTLGILSRELEGVNVVREYEDVAPLACSPALLNQVFLNLIRNAREAIGPGGTTVGHPPDPMLRRGTIRITLRETDGRIVIVVEDDGRGIDEADLPRVLDPGFTTKGVGVGAGLGLAISYQVVTDHGGDIAVTSKLGQGTRVTVRLPR